VLYLGLVAWRRPAVLRHLVELMRDSGREQVADLLEKVAPALEPDAARETIVN
jgi:hypothetical protein